MRPADSILQWLLAQKVRILIAAMFLKVEIIQADVRQVLRAGGPPRGPYNC